MPARTSSCFQSIGPDWYPSSRHLLLQATSAAGEVVFAGIPPGTYFAVALRTIPNDDNAWQDPAFLDGIRPLATITSIGEGQMDTVALQVARP